MSAHPLDLGEKIRHFQSETLELPETTNDDGITAWQYCRKVARQGFGLQACGRVESGRKLLFKI
jgi:hypothetical protein